MSETYAVRVGYRAVEGWSTIRLPFQPKGWLLDYRDELRAALRGLVLPYGHRLHALYAAPDEGAFVDTENVLLYNIGSAPLRHLIANGIVFERSFTVQLPPADSRLPTTGLHYHRYWVGPDAGLTQWERTDVLASFTDVGVERLDKPGPVWAAIRTQTAPPDRTRAAPARFTVDLQISGRSSTAPNPTDLIKPALDGIISAFHCHAGETEAVAERLSAAGCGPSSTIARMLSDSAWAALGRRQLVKPFGSGGVQWNPADDLCVAASITPTGADPNVSGSGACPRWSLSGRLVLVEPL